MGVQSNILLNNLLYDSIYEDNYNKKKYDFLCRLGVEKTSNVMKILLDSNGGIFHQSLFYELLLPEGIFIMRDDIYLDDINLPSIHYNLNNNFLGAYFLPPEQLLTWLSEEMKTKKYSFWSVILSKITNKDSKEDNW